MQRPARPNILSVVLLAFVILFAVGIARTPEQKEPFTYSRFLAHVESGGLDKVRLDAGDNSAKVTPKRGGEYETAYPDNTEQNLVNTLRAEKVPIEVKAKTGGGWSTALIYILPFVIFLLFWLFIINQMQGGGSKVMSFGKSRAKRTASG